MNITQQSIELTLISADEVYLDGKRLDIGPSLKLANHSPSGFGWGYMGSGPSQLALAILLEIMPSNASWYQKFKTDFISKIPQDPCRVTFDFWAYFRNKGIVEFEVEPISVSSDHSGQNHSCTKGWADRCANSKGKHCDCQCGGHNHGTAIRGGLKVAKL